MSLRIIIVDDLRFMRTIIHDVLESSGFIVAGEAENGIEGVALFEKVKPDLVLLDITMPKMDGITALKEIRKRDPQANVIMCSALGQQKYIIKAIQLGARDFIVKPFNPERILSAINKVVLSGL